MSILFKPLQLKNIKIKNRFIHSATYEAMATKTGEVTDSLVKRYQLLAKGQVGLIIPGYMYVHPLGRAYRHQTGIHNDDMVPGLKRMTTTVHKEGGTIMFQLAHAGRQTVKALIGSTPIAPSSVGRDPINFVKPREMTEGDIREVIRSFGAAAGRAVKAGADGIQLHAAHGYLIHQFLSPFFNRRKDGWGGSDVKRFRLLREIIVAVKAEIPKGMPLLVKLNVNDYTPREGITPVLASRYAEWLAELKIDGLEISCGTASYSYMNMCRGDVPAEELVSGLPFWKKPFGKLMMKQMVGQYNFEKGYNLEAAKIIKQAIGKVPLFAVGGLRKVADMKEILESHQVDGISMSRPFIKEPLIVKKIKKGRAAAVACISCNRCLAAVAGGMPVQCYQKGIPL